MRTIRVDADIRNADWAKRTWDVWWQGRLVTDLATLRRRFSDEQIRAMPHLPVWPAAPPALRAEITEWLTQAD